MSRLWEYCLNYTPRLSKFVESNLRTVYTAAHVISAECGVECKARANHAVVDIFEQKINICLFISIVLFAVESRFIPGSIKRFLLLTEVG